MQLMNEQTESDHSDHGVSHIAIICDGNRRWARSRGWEVFKGHEQAVNKVFEPLIMHAQSRGIQFITFWIFSTENWKREKNEVDFLMNLFRSFFDRQVEELHKKNVRVNMIGNISAFAPDIQEKIRTTMEQTKHNTGIVVTLAMNYGGRDELTRAMKRIAQKVEAGELSAGEITREVLAAQLDTAGAHLANAAVVPDPEIIVRTGGEQRMSGFLSWQHEYAEFFFPEFAFPDFSNERLDEILKEFVHRQRRFGK